MDRTFKLHQLCPTCAAIVAKSRILRTKSLERGTEEDTKVGVRQTETEEYTYMTAAALLLSANEGCHLCSLLYEQAEKGNIIVEDGPVFTLIIEREHYDDHSGPVWLYLRVEEARLWAWLEISEGPYMKSPSDGEIKGALFSGRTSSNGWFDNINNWLRDCRDGHAHCRVTNTGAELPSRLLDVGTSAQGAEQLPVRLCSTCDMAQNPLYLTLSYCWGKARFLRLLGENHDECFRGIPESKLPATFRDAVTVTRRLGFRYLWIDSLCIIQDSEADWVAESAKMGDVYRCAVLTISALWGSDPYAGLFTQCRPLSFEDCVLQIEGKPVRIDAHTRPKIPKGPLLRRGWVFQERVLCPRTLFYSKGTIFWECIQREANDKHDKVLPPLNRKYESQWTSKQYVHYLAKRLEWDEWNDGNSQYGPKQLRMHRSWYELQRDYHMLDFTLETDRLVAIRGLITLVGCGDSVAGLRRDMMLPELLWDSMVIQSDHRIIGEQDIAEEKYIGPSWSWACLKPTVSSSTSPRNGYLKFFKGVFFFFGNI